MGPRNGVIEHMEDYLRYFFSRLLERVEVKKGLEEPVSSDERE